MSKKLELNFTEYDIQQLQRALLDIEQTDSEKELVFEWSYPVEERVFLGAANGFKTETENIDLIIKVIK